MCSLERPKLILHLSIRFIKFIVLLVHFIQLALHCRQLLDLFLPHLIFCLINERVFLRLTRIHHRYQFRLEPPFRQCISHSHFIQLFRIHYSPLSI